MERTVDLSPMHCEIVCQKTTQIIRNQDDHPQAKVEAARELQTNVANAETTHTIGKTD